jgi:hypothetical protein
VNQGRFGKIRAFQGEEEGEQFGRNSERRKK